MVEHPRRLVVDFEESEFAKLERLARQDRRSLAELVRRAVSELLSREL